MHTLLPPFPVPPWYTPATQLRVDVNLDPSSIEQELEALYARLKRPDDVLYNLPTLPLNYKGFTFRYREADGEHYIYVEDNRQATLAGYVIFNRLVELSRQADPHLRAPHAKFAPAYQRLGLARAVYGWWLDAGNCLISGARQSVGANALWHALSKQYPLMYVDLRNKQLRYLSRQVDEARRQDLHTRILMLGRNCPFDDLATRIGLAGAADLGSNSLPTRLWQALRRTITKLLAR
jgi:hypothetical protein